MTPTTHITRTLSQPLLRLQRVVVAAVVVVLALLVCCAPAAHAQSRILYVDSDASGRKDGSSWADAFDSLTAALAAAAPGDQIWVASGVYKPGVTPDATFALKPGVAVYGGFRGDETALRQRNWRKYITVLSGDLDNDDDNADGNFIAESYAQVRGQNAQHVVTAKGLHDAPILRNTILSGFTISGGWASGEVPAGGGMLCISAGGACSPTLQHLIFSGNLAGDVEQPGMGGALFIAAGADGAASPLLSNILFRGNFAALGGALHNLASRPTLTKVTFLDNVAASAQRGGKGGGIYNDKSSTPLLTDVSFYRNRADAMATIYSMASSTGAAPVLVNITAFNNLEGDGAVATAATPQRSLVQVEAASIADPATLSQSIFLPMIAQPDRVELSDSQP